MLHREAPTEPEGTDSVGEREYSDWLTGQPQVSCSRSLPLAFAGHKVVTGGLLTSPLLSNLLTVWYGFTFVQFFMQIPIFFFSSSYCLCMQVSTTRKMWATAVLKLLLSTNYLAKSEINTRRKKWGFTITISLTILTTQTGHINDSCIGKVSDWRRSRTDSFWTSQIQCTYFYGPDFCLTLRI